MKYGTEYGMNMEWHSIGMSLHHRDSVIICSVL